MDSFLAIWRYGNGYQALTPNWIWECALPYTNLVHPRKITFVIDERGNSGKTWLSGVIRRRYEEKVFLCLPGRKADMVYALNTLGYSPHVCIIDAPRSKQGEYLQYDFLEELKNGRVFNTKYESRMIEFPIPHVVVMMNEEPDMTKLSSDRYNLIYP